MRPRLILPAAALALTLAAPSAAAGQGFAPDRVVVRYDDGTSRAARRDVQRATGTGFERRLPGGTRTLEIEDGETVGETVAELRANPHVDYAVPDHRLTAAQLPPPFIPNDPGRGGPGGWQDLQWNFTGPFGVNAPQAWALSRQTPAPGGRGAVVAVIDSGVAYRDRGGFRRAPDLYSKRWTSPYDFVDEDRVPLDEDGHGTHVTGTIAQATNNGRGVTGLAYGVTIMPLRVLDENGNGDGSNFVRALRYAARHGADVINMSVEFDSELRAADIPDVIAAMRYAHSKGAVLVGASGNDSAASVAYPSTRTRGPGSTWSRPAAASTRPRPTTTGTASTATPPAARASSTSRRPTATRATSSCSASRARRRQRRTWRRSPRSSSPRGARAVAPVRRTSSGASSRRRATSARPGTTSATGSAWSTRRRR
jgi:serine protease